MYVTNILVKLTLVEDLTHDLEETFAILRKYSMKFNLNKYIFGIKSGWFLGYLVTKWGIDDNLKKVQALQEMRSRRNIREA